MLIINHRSGEHRAVLTVLGRMVRRPLLDLGPIPRVCFPTDPLSRLPGPNPAPSDSPLDMHRHHPFHLAQRNWHLRRGRLNRSHRRHSQHHLYSQDKRCALRPVQVLDQNALSRIYYIFQMTNLYLHLRLWHRDGFHPGKARLWTPSSTKMSNLYKTQSKDTSPSLRRKPVLRMKWRLSRYSPTI